MIDDDTLQQVVGFHGHMCPGLAMGMQAAQICLAEIGTHSKDEEVVAAVETDMCAVDAIQVLTGCTFGKGNFIHRDWGKNAYTFYRRSDGKGIRLSGKPNAWQRDEEHTALFARIRAGEASEAERARFGELHEASARKVLALDPYDLFEVKPIQGPLPRAARIHTTISCESCGEGVMETRIHILGGRQLCTPCFDAAS